MAYSENGDIGCKIHVKKGVIIQVDDIDIWECPPPSELYCMIFDILIILCFDR